MWTVLGGLWELFVKAVFFPHDCACRLVDGIIGGPDWQEHRRKMRWRTPLSDEAFLDQAGVAQADGPMVLEVRDRLADYAGLPRSALYAGDDLPSLQRLAGLMGPAVEWIDVFWDLDEDLEEAMGKTLFLDSRAREEFRERVGRCARKATTARQLVIQIVHLVREQSGDQVP